MIRLISTTCGIALLASACSAPTPSHSTPPPPPESLATAATMTGANSTTAETDGEAAELARAVLTDLFTQAWAAVGVSFTSIDCFLADIDETGSVEELAHLMDIHEVRHPAGLSDAATDPFFETLITPESLSCLTSAEQEAVSRVRVG